MTCPVPPENASGPRALWLVFTWPAEGNRLPTAYIQVLDRRGVAWRKLHDINFVNIDDKAFDVSNWPRCESGRGFEQVCGGRKVLIFDRCLSGLS